MNAFKRDPAAVFAGILVAALLVLSGMYLFSQAGSAKAGSLEGDYSITATSTMASSTAATQLKYGPGALGSVIIASSSPTTVYPAMTIYDATSTQATTSAKVLAKFGGGNQEHGTYVFDAAAAYGIKVEIPVGFNGAYTITWR